MKKINNYIDGSITSSSENYLPIYNPSTGEKTGEVVNSNIVDFKKVIESSNKAFNLWKNVTPLEKVKNNFKI